MLRQACIALLLLVAVGGAAADLSAGDKARARKLYVAKCAKCHKFYEPRNYDEARWREWMQSMSRKSKLKAEDETLLNSYLDEYRAGRVASAR